MFNVQHHDVQSHGRQVLDSTLYDPKSHIDTIDLTWSPPLLSKVANQGRTIYSSRSDRRPRDESALYSTTPSSKVTTANNLGTAIPSQARSHDSPKRIKSARYGDDSLLDRRLNKHSSPKIPSCITLPKSMESSTSNRRYLLHIIQQPSFGCAFGSRLLSRLAIAPALIVRLQVIDLAGREIDIDDLSPFLVCQVSLLSDTGIAADVLEPLKAEEDADEPGKGGRPTGMTAPITVAAPVTRAAASMNSRYKEGERPVRMLYGTLTASLQKLHLPNSTRLENIFAFPEISIRSRGRFRLQVNLMQLPLPTVNSTDKGRLLASISTEVFPVVLSSEYIEPHVTELSRHLADQGVKLLIPSTQDIE